MTHLKRNYFNKKNITINISVICAVNFISVNLANAAQSGPDIIIKLLRPFVTSKIDRQSYDMKNDIAAQNGTAADALNKVPSLSVDTDGNVSLRGKTNVKILIDGRESPLMKGDNQASSILSMPGGDIDSIEVLNNPGAAYSSEGSSGIINIKLKKNRKPGKYVSLMLNAGNNNRYNGSANANYNSKKLSVSGGVSYRVDNRKYNSSSQTINNDGSSNSYNSIQSGERKSLSIKSGIDYNINKNNTIGGALSYDNSNTSSQSEKLYHKFDNLDDQIQSYNQDTNRTEKRKTTTGNINYSHKNDANQEFKTSLTSSRTITRSINSDDYDYIIPDNSQTIKNNIQKSDTKSIVFNTDYSTNINNDKLTFGHQINIDNNNYNNYGYIIKNNAVTIDNSQLDNLKYSQEIFALYTTYQKQINDKLSAQIGERVEHTNTNIFDTQNNTSTSKSYINASPSVFVQYSLSDNDNLRFSYSKRLKRPVANDLNPAMNYKDSNNISVGNPDLKPENTDSFEISYEKTKGKDNYQIKAFSKNTNNTITQKSEYIADNVVLNTKINGGNETSNGLEIAINKALSKKLTMNLNSIISHDEMDSLLASKSKISGNNIAAHLNMNYDINSNDKLQFMFANSGKQINPQGYNTGRVMNVLSYSHKLTPLASLNLNVSNPFGAPKSKTYFETNDGKTISYRNSGEKIFTIGLRMNLGAAPKAKTNDNIEMPKYMERH